MTRFPRHHVEDRTLAVHQISPELSAVEIADKLKVKANSVRYVLYRHKIIVPSFFARRRLGGKPNA